MHASFRARDGACLFSVALMIPLTNRTPAAHRKSQAPRPHVLVVCAGAPQ